jgi:hypothetical protein
MDDYLVEKIGGRTGGTGPERLCCHKLFQTKHKAQRLFPFSLHIVRSFILPHARLPRSPLAQRPRPAKGRQPDPPGKRFYLSSIPSFAAAPNSSGTNRNPAWTCALTSLRAVLRPGRRPLAACQLLLEVAQGLLDGLRLGRHQGSLLRRQERQRRPAPLDHRRHLRARLHH